MNEYERQILLFIKSLICYNFFKEGGWLMDTTYMIKLPKIFDWVFAERTKRDNVSHNQQSVCT